MIIKVENWYFVKTLYEYGDIHVMSIAQAVSRHQSQGIRHILYEHSVSGLKG